MIFWLIFFSPGVSDSVTGMTGSTSIVSEIISETASVANSGSISLAVLRRLRVLTRMGVSSVTVSSWSGGEDLTIYIIFRGAVVGRVSVAIAEDSARESAFSAFSKERDN